MPKKEDELLGFLTQHQPMPGDNDISERESSLFMEALEYFQANINPKCIPLFIGSVSTNTGLGMYEHIQFVLMAHQKSEVVPQLRYGLVQGNEGVKYRCCWWAADIDGWELEDVIQPLVFHKDEDIRDAAKSFIKLKHEMA